MPFFQVFCFIFSFFSFADKPVEKPKALSWSISHNLSRGALVSSRFSLTNGMGLSYKWKDLSISANSSYTLPLSPVSDDTYYGWSDVGLNVSLPLSFLKIPLLDTIPKTALGLTLPSSENSRNAGKYLGAHASLSYGTQIKWFYASFSHVIYSGFYRYHSGKSAHIQNKLASSSHTASLRFSYKDFSASMSCRGYLYAYLADMNKLPHVEDLHLRYNGSGGFAFQLSQAFSTTLIKAFSFQAYLRSSLNLPIISPVLTDFSFRHRWQYSGGLSWNIK